MAGILIAMSSVVAQALESGVLTAADVQRLLPATFFYSGQSAPVQMRNAAGVRSAHGKVLLAALVDVSGYSSAITEKYQGLLLLDGTAKVGGKPLAAGAYGLGVLPDGSFLVTDLGGGTVLSAALTNDDTMRRPVPLQIREVDGKFRLYLGKKYVTLEFAATH